MIGTIFDIKEFALHDGPGPRVTVFLKGCPLRCRWCHNPEGLSPKPQLMVKENLCTHCGRCRIPCTHPSCAPFDRCLHACPNGLVSVSGETVEAAVLVERLRPNLELVQSMGGGVTFSGGEPLMQADFLLELCELLSPFHKTLETSGFAKAEIFSKVCQKMDYVMMDLKLADPTEHKRQTGVDNAVILQNFRWLKQSGIPFRIRTPLIPNITDTDENLSALAELIGDCEWEKLDYNPFAGAKYSMLGMQFGLEENKN